MCCDIFKIAFQFLLWFYVYYFINTNIIITFISLYCLPSVNKRAHNVKTAGYVVCVDFSCAMQKEILAHGRLYVSRQWICFYANIFRWETAVCCLLLLHIYYMYSVLGHSCIWDPDVEMQQLPLPVVTARWKMAQFLWPPSIVRENVWNTAKKRKKSRFFGFWKKT